MKKLGEIGLVIGLLALGATALAAELEYFGSLWRDQKAEIISGCQGRAQ
jgi:hypothetical protein